MLTPAQLSTLKGELVSDPRAYGYPQHIPTALGGTGSALDSNAVAALINLRRDGTNGGPAIVIKRNDVPASEILAAIDVADLLSTANVLQGSWFEKIMDQTGENRLTLFDEADQATIVLANIRALLPGAGNASKTRVNTLAKRNGSRAEELGFGKGYVVSDVDVEAAIRLP